LFSLREIALPLNLGLFLGYTTSRADRLSTPRFFRLSDRFFLDGEDKLLSLSYVGGAALRFAFERPPLSSFAE